MYLRDLETEYKTWTHTALVIACVVVIVAVMDVVVVVDVIDVGVGVVFVDLSRRRRREMVMKVVGEPGHLIGLCDMGPSVAEELLEVCCFFGRLVWEYHLRSEVSGYGKR